MHVLRTLLNDLSVGQRGCWHAILRAFSVVEVITGKVLYSGRLRLNRLGLVTIGRRTLSVLCVVCLRWASLHAPVRVPASTCGLLPLRCWNLAFNLKCGAIGACLYVSIPNRSS